MRASPVSHQTSWCLGPILGHLRANKPHVWAGGADQLLRKPPAASEKEIGAFARQGGELFDRVTQLKRFTERDAGRPSGA